VLVFPLAPGMSLKLVFRDLPGSTCCQEPKAFNILPLVLCAAAGVIADYSCFSPNSCLHYGQ
jgi:hypothetical protein